MQLIEPQRRAFTVLLDELIPASLDRSMPGAGELGIAEAIVGDLGTRPEGFAGLVAALAALEEASQAAFHRSFAEIASNERATLVEGLGESQPGFIPGLLFAIYATYYAHPRIRASLGRGDRPPHPGGYPLEPFDESLLEPVRARGALFRDC